MSNPTKSLFAFAFCAFIVCGCASPLEVGLDTSVTQAPRFTQEGFETKDGKRLAVQTWESSRPSAVVVGIHGMNDYSQTFAMLGPWLADRGVSLYAYDQRGFGASPHTGTWAGTEAMVEDARAFINQLNSQHSDLPVYVIGVSMGAAVTLVALSRASDLPVEGIVLVSPAVWGWSSLNPLYKSVLWLVAHTAPAQSFSGSGLEIWPSDNIEMLRANARDPLMIKETRTDAIFGLVNLMEDAYQKARTVDIPALILYGEKDEIIPARPVAHIVNEMQQTRRLAVYEDGYHMLLRDLQAEIVWEDILAWIEDGAVPLPSGAEQSMLTAP